MKRISYINSFLFFSVLIAPRLALCESKDTLRLDLAVNDAGSVKEIQGNNTYDIIMLENVISDFSYSIEIKNTSTLLPSIDYDPSGVASNPSIPAGCESLFEIVKNLQNFQSASDPDQDRDEKILSKIVGQLRSEIQKTNCQDIDILSYAKEWLNSTKKVHNEKIQIGTGEKITITIKRDTLVWTFIFNGNERGQWVTTYGFGFTSQRTESQTYFTKQMPDTAAFQILKGRRAEVWDLNYVPAVFFSYFPAQRFSSCWNHSLTAGLGFDLSAPVVFFGYNGLFYNNIGVSAGVSFQQQYRLKEQYSENEIVSITLDKDQLHDKVYRPNFFVSINFRFGENPFKNKDEPTIE